MERVKTRNFKNCKNIIFSIVFCKNEKIYKSASWWSGKKIFRGGWGGPKNEFKTPLWHAAIKICGRLIRFLHFWWFHVFVFWFSKKSQKLHFQKMHFFQFFSSNFIKFAHFFLFFTFFVSKIPFFYRNFSIFRLMRQRKKGGLGLSSDEGKYLEFRKNPRTPKEMTNEICIEFKTVIFC